MAAEDLDPILATVPGHTSTYGDPVALDWLDELGLWADGPPWLSMGLRRVDDDGWLLTDDQREAELALRARLVRERPGEVLHLTADTQDAGAEVLELVTAWLAARDFEVGPAHAADEHPLVTAGRLVQEDLCLMVPRPDVDTVVRHHLDAAVLCFPSHWRLADKAGRPAAALHGPVPGYDVELADRVDRYLARLRPGAIGVRRNWSVHDSPELFAPDPPTEARPATAAEVPERLWLRSERQTLRALPESGSVLFTIRVQQTPFGALAQRPQVASALADRLRAQPAELTAMNGLTLHHQAVLTWLDGLAP